jgi:hypothetical protein
MAIETCLTTAGRLAFLQGKIKPNHVFKIALYTDKANLGKSTKVYSPINEVTAQGYKPAILNAPVFSESEDVAVMDFPGEVTWANVSISAAGCLIYDTDLADLAIAVGSFGATITSTNDKFTLAPEADLIKFI